MGADGRAFLEKWHRIVRERDKAGVREILAENVEMGAPPHWRKLEGREWVGRLLGVIMDTIEDFTYHREWVNGGELALELHQRRNRAQVGDGLRGPADEGADVSCGVRHAGAQVGDGLLRRPVLERHVAAYRHPQGGLDVQQRVPEGGHQVADADQLGADGGERRYRAVQADEHGLELRPEPVERRAEAGERPGRDRTEYRANVGFENAGRAARRAIVGNRQSPVEIAFGKPVVH